MTTALRIPPAPVGQQAPPTRAAASDSWTVTPRRARVPPIVFSSFVKCGGSPSP